jgi:S-formylglutathione hydrolase FrmB
MRRLCRAPGAIAAALVLLCLAAPLASLRAAPLEAPLAAPLAASLPAPLAASRPAALAHAGTLSENTFHAMVLQRPWTYEIYLPRDYAQSDRRYPVIYLLHGYNDVPMSWADKAGVQHTADQMIDRGQLQPCILVMPSAGRSWYIDGPEKMETAFIEDLIPQIDRNFRTVAARAGRMVAGLSMGGYGAMRLGLRHPDMFSAMALMSPAIYTPDPPFISGARVAPVFQTDGVFDPARWRAMNYPNLLDGFARADQPLRLQISAGLQDVYGTDAAAKYFYDAWRAHGWPAELKLRPGAHDFKLWREILPDALRFLVGPDTAVAANRGQRR